MPPQSAKPLEQIPGTLFEREELPSSAIVNLCLESLIIAAERLESVLDRVPDDTHARGILLERTKSRLERLLKTIGEARHRQLSKARGLELPR